MALQMASPMLSVYGHVGFGRDKLLEDQRPLEVNAGAAVGMLVVFRSNSAVTRIECRDAICGVPEQVN
jgi:hypothetical protein